MCPTAVTCTSWLPLTLCCRILTRTCSDGMLAMSVDVADAPAESLHPPTLEGGDSEPVVPSRLQPGEGRDIVGESRSAKFKSGDSSPCCCCDCCCCICICIWTCTCSCKESSLSFCLSYYRRDYRSRLTLGGERCEVLSAVTEEVIQCSRVHCYQPFRWTCCLHHQGRSVS